MALGSWFKWRSDAASLKVGVNCYTVTNPIESLECDRQMVLFNNLPSTNAASRFFNGQICEINPKDFRDIPAGDSRLGPKRPERSIPPVVWQSQQIPNN